MKMYVKVCDLQYIKTVFTCHNSDVLHCLCSSDQVMVSLISLTVLSAVPFSAARSLSPSQENANKIKACTPRSDNVNYTGLLNTYFEQLSKPRSGRPVPAPWDAMQNLQMFTPLPLQTLACGDTQSEACRASSSSGSAQRHNSRTAMWLNVYPGPQMEVNVGSDMIAAAVEEEDGSKANNCDKVHNNPHTVCSTDFNRFPPILCEATCKSPCGCCKRRSSELTSAHVLVINRCEGTNAVWRLKEVGGLLPISPNSCQCQS